MKKNDCAVLEGSRIDQTAGKLVALVGSRKALWIAAKTADTKKRYSLLKWRLKPKE